MFVKRGVVRGVGVEGRRRGPGGTGIRRAGHEDVLKELESATGVDCSAFRKVLAEKRQKGKLSKEEVDSLFEEYYAVTERLGNVVDEIQA